MKERSLNRGVVLLIAFCVSPVLPAEPPPASGSRDLDWSLGPWAGTRRDAATGQAVKLRLRVEPILGGVGHIEHLEAEHAEGPYLGFTVRMPTGKPGRWSMTYWNSKRPDAAQLKG